MAFRFKQFSVDDSMCAMKVGTDSVLLGAWADFSGADTILDIGTGCGILALMAAQKSSASITAIDIDEKACIQATGNFKNSPWPERLECLHSPLEQFSRKGYDHIITNPPYFINSLKSPDTGRNKSRHTDELPLNVLVKYSASVLSDNGKISIVFPIPESRILISLAVEEGINLSRKMVIIPKEGKPANRILLEFSKCEVVSLREEELIIRDHAGHYTKDYMSLTADFYLHLH